MKNIKSKIADLKTISNKSADYGDGGFDVKMSNQEKLFEELTSMARKEKTLLGRIIKFSAADSYAVYVIDKVNPKSVHVSWIDYCDGYCDRHFGGRGGNMRMNEALAYTQFEDYLDSMNKR